MPTPQKQRPGSSLARPSFPCSLSLVSFVCVTSFQHTPPRPISSPGKHGKSGLHFLIFLQRRTLFTESAWSSWWYLVFASSPQHPCIPPQVPCPLPAKPNENDFEALVGTDYQVSGIHSALAKDAPEGLNQRTPAPCIHRRSSKTPPPPIVLIALMHVIVTHREMGGRLCQTRSTLELGNSEQAKKKTRPRLARRRRRRKRLCDCDISRSLPKPKQQTHRHK